jgi:hypothetical protein
MLREIKEKFDNGFKGELIVPVEGGPLFMPIYPAGSGEGIENADINAATNIGLRAVAHPDRLDIFPLVKTDALSETRLRIRNARGAFAELPADAAEREVSLPAAEATDLDTQTVDAEEPDELESGARPNLFVDALGSGISPVAETFQVALSHSDRTWKSAKSAKFWPRVRDLANSRIVQLNSQRLASR